jgi:hypothetical protein
MPNKEGVLVQRKQRDRRVMGVERIAAEISELLRQLRRFRSGRYDSCCALQRNRVPYCREVAQPNDTLDLIRDRVIRRVMPRQQQAIPGS